jgi:ParB-like chromosome segregation protein Spo0J
MTDIVWTNVTVTLGQLQPWERNPKSISKSHAKRLLASWDKFGQFQTVAIGPGNEVYDGHQRLSVLRAAYGDGYQVAARQSSRELTDSERRELVIAAHVGTTGQFDWDELANWDAAELQEWGLDGETLQDWRTGIGALTELIGSEEPLPEFEEYTEDVENEVEYITCPECGHKWPK